MLTSNNYNPDRKSSACPQAASEVSSPLTELFTDLELYKTVIHEQAWTKGEQKHGKQKTVRMTKKPGNAALPVGNTAGAFSAPVQRDRWDTLRCC